MDVNQVLCLLDVDSVSSFSSECLDLLEEREESEDEEMPKSNVFSNKTP